MLQIATMQQKGGRRGQDFPMNRPMPRRNSWTWHGTLHIVGLVWLLLGPEWPEWLRIHFCSMGHGWAKFGLSACGMNKDAPLTRLGSVHGPSITMKYVSMKALVLTLLKKQLLVRSAAFYQDSIIRVV